MAGLIYTIVHVNEQVQQMLQQYRQSTVHYKMEKVVFHVLILAIGFLDFHLHLSHQRLPNRNDIVV